MTNQEAIEILEGLAVPIHAEAAFDMAVEALRTYSNDLISRQAALYGKRWVCWKEGPSAYRNEHAVPVSYLESLPSKQTLLSETDLIELEDRFGRHVRFVIEDMLNGKGKRWKI